VEHLKDPEKKNGYGVDDETQRKKETTKKQKS